MTDSSPETIAVLRSTKRSVAKKSVQYSVQKGAVVVQDAPPTKVARKKNPPTLARPTPAPKVTQNQIVKRLTITPQMAEEFLKCNSCNRRLSNSSVNTLARQMTNGTFQFNGDAIRFSAEGVLLDGQHRLTACVLSGIPFDTLVVFGLPASAQDTVDYGRKRTVADTMGLRKVPNAAVVSSACRWIYALAVGQTQFSITTPEALAFAAAYPGIIDSAAKAQTCNVLGTSRGLIAAIHFIGSYAQKVPEKADAFVAVLKTGIPAYEGDPVHLLRERYMTNRMNGTKPTDTAKLCGMVHVWNNFREDKALKLLRIPDTAVLTDYDPLFFFDQPLVTTPTA